MGAGELIYGVIPARAGSKGLPKKNKRNLNGRPLIDYTLKAACASRLDKVILSTDDQWIIDYVRENYPSILIPFKRPAELADDNVEASDVAIHLLEWAAKSIGQPYGICWLQPTSPFRTAEHINDCMNLFLLTKCDSVISVCSTSQSPYKMYHINERGTLAKLFPQNRITNRQSLPATYIHNGAIFLTKTSSIRSNLSFVGQISLPYQMKIEDSINIDSFLDFKLCEAICDDGIPAEC